ncbi:hypothetical protein AnigIFM60653_000188 [Aspergillus niger]|nr:hypothetical protein BDQ94DRAFT_167101 [Aspergillus welwitschiae]KAI2863431.1 hypothetical protein CBS12448_3988 [Aspergillus niger]KAI2915539.1 hypothetical protein CBS147371_5824 [Aspergillus niger]KAI2933711.1 hypothetical protein CBS147320_1567 [Aspergillus niger]KAI2957398.1 hypothetical protein CBS147324_10731 [Aspergillus niger]KAI2961432.1 hypothetical protein CBS147322_70 [Aspergillus niger]
MRFTTLSVLLLSTLALAFPESDPAIEKRDDTTDSDMPNPLSNLANPTTTMPTLFPEVPTSIRSDLITEVPTSVISEMTNPTAWSSVASEWRDGIVPSWYSSLNGDVKSYFSTAFETASPSTSSSHGGAGPGAPKPTGMAGIMGAAGILGMAIVL